MPTKYKAIKPGVNGVKYVYHITKTYVLAGKRKYDCVCIGKMDENTGMLIPNQTYYEFYSNNERKYLPYVDKNSIKSTKESSDNDPNLDENHSYHYGNYLILKNVADEVGLTELLKEVFSDDYEPILNIAYFMISEGNVMSKINIWQKSMLLNDDQCLNDSLCSSIFASIKFEQKIKFFEKWMHRHASDGYMLYDVTSIQNYSKYMPRSQFGYHGKHTRLPQFNLGMYFGQTSGLPLYYNLYQGSITDKCDLKFMVEHTISLGLKNVTFVIDRGFCTNKNLFLLKNNDFNFITPLSSSRKIYKKILEQNMKDVNSINNWIKDMNIYGMTVHKLIAGVDTNVHIFYDTNKIKDDEKEIFDRIDNLQLGMENIKKAKCIPVSYAKYFDISFKKKDKNGVKFSYSLNSDKINEMKSYCGYFMIITSDTSLSAETVLTEYRKRDAIEKSFMIFKNELEFNRFRTHNDATTDGKMFIQFLSFILETCIANKIIDNAVSKRVQKLSVQDILYYSKEYCLMIINGKKHKSTLSKIQNEIFESLGISVE
jgi:transposase